MYLYMYIVQSRGRAVQKIFSNVRKIGFYGERKVFLRLLQLKLLRIPVRYINDIISLSRNV